MFYKIVRYFKGFLRIRISGNAVERFINTCSYKGICIWNLSSCKSKYEMNITIKDFKRLKPVIRKTGTKVLIVDRTGFPFFLQKFHRRKLFFTGFFLCIFLIYLMSTYIWNIEITGNLINTNENILDYLEKMDIEEGMKRKKVNCSVIVKEIRKHYDDIIWVSASVEGTNLILKIKENEDSKDLKDPERKDTETPYDIKADFPCQITSLITRKGVPQVKEGDVVKKGDILVSGQIPILNDAKEITDYSYCISDADIYGKTTYIYEDQLERIYYEKKYSGIERKLYHLKIANHRIIFGDRNKDYELFEDFTFQKSFKGFSFTIQEIYPYTLFEKSYSNNELQKILSENFHYYCAQLEKKGVVILQNDVKIYTWSDMAKATGSITVERPVGQKEKSEFIEIGDHINGNDGNNN